MTRIYLDTETTGLSPARGAAIVEVAAVVTDDDGGELSVYQSLVNPGPAAMNEPHVDEALRVNGITRDEIARADAAGVVAGRLYAFLLYAYFLHEARGVTLHSFNVSFDADFLARPPWLLPRRRWDECIMAAAMVEMGAAGALPRFERGRFKWPKLSEAVAFYRVRVDGAPHRALGDARAAAAIHQAILEHRAAKRQS